MSKPTPKILAWHFLAADGRQRVYLPNGGTRPGKLVNVGQVSACCPPLILCKHGLHASVCILDALQYAPGPVCCRVEMSGTIQEGQDKLCSTRRRVLAMADIATILHEFACDCAEGALKIAEVEDPRSWAALEAKRRWLRGEITDEELDAAWDAAWVAVRSTVRSAVREAAWVAARSAQNSDLERRVLAATTESEGE